MSLVIAFGIWAFVTNERDPDTTQVVSAVSLEPRDLADNFQIVESLPEVEVTVKGPRSIVQDIDTDAIEASVDMSAIAEPGTYELDVDILDPGGLREIQAVPESVEVRIDSVVSETFDVTLVEPTDPPALLTSINLSTTTVTVTGVRQNVEEVARVELPVLLSGRTESFTYAAQPVPVGSNGEALDSDTVSVVPEAIQVSVEFEIGSRSVPVVVQCACQTAEGTMEIRDLSNATAIPPTVRIEGPQPLLDEISSIKTVPISIDDVEVSAFLPGAVELDTSTFPDGVSVDIPSVGVYVQIEPSTEEIIEQDIQVINAASNLRVDLSSASVSFELQGSAATLARLEDNPPVVVIDLDGYDEGTYTLSPRILLPPDVRAVNLDPVEVEVTIERPPPSTPTPSPTPDPDANTPTSSLPARRIDSTPTTVSDTTN